MLVGRRRELSVLAACLARNEPVAITGAAGVGKTTLLRAAASRSGRPVHEGRGLATLSWTSYLPLTMALGHSPPAGDHAATAAWVVERVDGGVLLHDDVQWADPETLAVLPLLAGRLGLLLALRLGDVATERARAAVVDAGGRLVELERLTDEEAEALLRLRRPGLSKHGSAAVLTRAEGNALLPACSDGGS